MPHDEVLEAGKTGLQLELAIRVVPASDSFTDLVEAVQRGLIRWALHAADGVKAHAAELLGMKYSTFWQTADRLDADRPVPADVSQHGSPDRTVQGGPGTECCIDSVALELVVSGGARRVDVSRSGDEPLFDVVVQELQCKLAARALRRSGGVISRAAERLGVKYPTFYALVRRLGLHSAS